MFAFMTSVTYSALAVNDHEMKISVVKWHEAAGVGAKKSTRRVTRIITFDIQRLSVRVKKK